MCSPCPISRPRQCASRTVHCPVLLSMGEPLTDSSSATALTPVVATDIRATGCARIHHGRRNDRVVPWRLFVFCVFFCLFILAGNLHRSWQHIFYPIFWSAVCMVAARCKLPFALRPGLSHDDKVRTKEATKESNKRKSDHPLILIRRCHEGGRGQQQWQFLTGTQSSLAPSSSTSPSRSSSRSRHSWSSYSDA